MRHIKLKYTFLSTRFNLAILNFRQEENRMTKTHDIPKPTAAELDLLQALWPLGTATAKQVHEEIGRAHV